MNAQTKNNIFSTLQNHQIQIKNFGVKKLGLFGSFVHQQQDANSDIDVLVEFEPDRKTFDNFLNVALFLEELFDRPVELVRLQTTYSALSFRPEGGISACSPKSIPVSALAWPWVNGPRSRQGWAAAQPRCRSGWRR